MRQRHSQLLAGLLITMILLGGYSAAFGKDASDELLQRGIREYRMEFYEEAIETLTEARRLQPQSSLAAFMLGMAYKQTMVFQQAQPHFEDAVTLEPRIKEALPELINVHYHLGNTEEAKHWIAVAEREEIMLAPVSFLKGLVLQREGKYLESVEAFDRAKEYDEKMSQSADFQIGVSYMMARRHESAKERFQAAIVADPSTDLGTYARRYQDLVEERLFLERPLRFTLGLFGRFDSNVVTKPDSALFSNITNEASLAVLPSFRVDYVPVLEGRKLFNASYSLGATILDKNSSTHNLLGNTVAINPGYRFGNRSALNFNVTYGHYLLGGHRYMETLSFGPLYRYMLSERHILEVFGGYVFNNYFQDATPPAHEWDRDNEGIKAYASWVWLFARDSFFNARYEFTNENADGLRYDNKGHRFSLNTIFPIAEDVKFQASLGYVLRDFSHTLEYWETDGTSKFHARKDNQYSASAGLTWAATRQLNVIAQYSGLRNRSNTFYNTYTRHMVTTGIEYKF